MRIKPASNSFFLEAATPLFSRELLRPLRLMSLIVGIGILIAGSIWTPSIDWDVPLCFVMGLPAYVLAPWAFRQMYYLRWKWMPLAGLAMWFVIDGVYSAYWTLMGFDSLAIFRPANFFYCIWLFWISGFVWNIDLSKMKDFLPRRLKDADGCWACRMWFACRLILTILLMVILTGCVGCLRGFNWSQEGSSKEFSLDACGLEEIDGIVVSTVVDVKPISCTYIEALNRWDIRLAVRLKIQNCTRETMSLLKFGFDSCFSETPVYARDRTGQLLRFMTYDYGPVRWIPKAIAVRDLEPNASSEYEVKCGVLVSKQIEDPNSGVDWLFPCREGWFYGGVKLIDGNLAGRFECRYKIEGQLDSSYGSEVRDTDGR